MEIVAYYDGYEGEEPHVPSNASRTPTTTIVDGVLGAPDNSAILIPGGGTASSMRFPVSVALTDVLSGYFYFTYPEIPPSAMTMFTLRPSNAASSISLAVTGTTNPGAMRLLAPGNEIVVASPINTFLPGEVYRVNVDVFGVANVDRQVNVLVYPLGEEHNPIWEASYVALPTAAQTPITFIDIGKINNTPTTTAWAVEELYFEKQPYEVQDDFPTKQYSDYDDFSSGPGDNWFQIDADGHVESSGELVGPAIARGPGGIPTPWESHPDEVQVYKINQSGTDTGYLDFSIPAASNLRSTFVRSYFRIVGETWPDTSFSLIALKESNAGYNSSLSVSGSIVPGQIRLTTVGGAQLATSPSNTIRRNTWYRTELVVDPANSSAKVAVFTLGLDGPIWQSGWISNPNFAKPNNMLHVGRISTTPKVTGLEMDMIAGRFYPEDQAPPAGHDYWLGRHLDDVPPEYRAYIWNGVSVEQVSHQTAFPVLIKRDWATDETSEHNEPYLYLHMGADRFHINPNNPA